MLSIGLTGGIAAGKSLLSTRFRELGAVVIDADQLARDVVAPGTPGLLAVVERFGPEILLPDGSLNRPALGARVFVNKSELADLNAITHPLVRAAATVMKNDAGPGTVVVQDIPLLVETGQGPNFHLVLVVQASVDERLRRMIADRGMSRDEALARIAAQASDVERAAVADVLIENHGDPAIALAALDSLWHDRLLPYAANLAAARPADHVCSIEGPVEVLAAERLVARISHALGERALSVRAINIAEGSGRTVPIRVEIRVERTANTTSEQLTEDLAEVGFFPKSVAAREKALPNQPRLDSRNSTGLWTASEGSFRFGSADPGCPVIIVVLPGADARIGQ